VSAEPPHQLTAAHVPLASYMYERDRIDAIAARAEAELREAGLALVTTGPVAHPDDVERAVAKLRSADWDLLILNVINWIDVRAAARVALAFRERAAVLYSYGGRTEGNVLISPAAGAGSTGLRYPLERFGMRFDYLFNAPDTPMDTASVLSMARAARAERRLRNMRLGMVGAHDMGLYTTPFDVTRLRGRIGPEVESVDLLQLQRAADGIPAAEVEREAGRLAGSWDEPFGTIPGAVLERAVRLALGTLRICREHGFDAFSYKSVEGVSLELGTTHNLASSLIASAGVPYIDENDMLNLTAQLMLGLLAGGTPSFLEHYEHSPDWILLGVDGYVPDGWIEGRPRVKPVSSIATGQPVGVAQCSRMRPGRLTLACLAEADSADGYRMHLVTGEGESPPDWEEMSVPGPLPSLRFVPDGSVRTILDHVQSQHFAAAHGDHADDLEHLCMLLGIPLVADR
jgi:L-fucose isomerase-like protein